MEKILPQLDVKQYIKLKDRFNVQNHNILTEKDKQLERYADFFKEIISEIDNVDDNYTALEILNDDGLLVSAFMKDKPNFKVCHMQLVKLLTEESTQLSKINLVHAVLPIDDAYSLVQILKKVPEVTNADTRVILGAYDDYNDLEHEQNRRVLRGLMNGLDFWNYERRDVQGTCLRMVYSTYQKNMKMRH